MRGKITSVYYTVLIIVFIKTLNGHSNQQSTNQLSTKGGQFLAKGRVRDGRPM